MMGTFGRCARALLALGAFALAACGGGGGESAAVPPTVGPVPDTVVSAPPTRSALPVISISSDSGDYIGQGRNYTYDTSNAAIRLTARGALLDIQVSGRESWSATFLLPGTLNELRPGTYTGLSRYPFQTVGNGAMAWTGEGRGCNMLIGTVVIDSVSYQSGLLQAIDMSFEQACDGSAAALRGRVRVDAQTMSAVTPPQNALPSQPVVTLTSESGDYIGGGASYAYASGSSSVVIRAERDLLTVNIAGDQNWTGNFLMPGGATLLAPGNYRDLARYPFQAAGAGGFSWYGEGRGCNTLIGSVTIHSVRYDTAGVLMALEMDFEQRCEGGPATLRGRITWDASVPVPAAQPDATPPAGLWQPPEGAMPATGNAMYIASDWNDYIGGGYTFWVNSGGALPGAPSDVRGTVAVSISEVAGLFRLGVTGAVNWSAEFKAMDGLTRLQPGYYGIVQRYPFHNPKRGGMNFSMESRGCNQLSGWFMVDRVTYQDDKLASIDMRFAQYCDNGLSALRGRIRWSASTVPL